MAVRISKRYLLLFAIFLGICGVIYWRHNATEDVTELPKSVCTLEGARYVCYICTRYPYTSLFCGGYVYYSKIS